LIVIPQPRKKSIYPLSKLGKIPDLIVILAHVWVHGDYLIVLAPELSTSELEASHLLQQMRCQKIYKGVWAQKFMILAGLAAIITVGNSFFVVLPVANICHWDILGMYTQSNYAVHPKYQNFSRNRYFICGP